MARGPTSTKEMAHPSSHHHTPLEESISYDNAGETGSTISREVSKTHEEIRPKRRTSSEDMIDCQQQKVDEFVPTRQNKGWFSSIFDFSIVMESCCVRDGKRVTGNYASRGTGCGFSSPFEKHFADLEEDEVLEWHQIPRDYNHSAQRDLIEKSSSCVETPIDTDRTRGSKKSVQMQN